MCEVEQCCHNADFAVRSRKLPFECQHIQSLMFCPRTDKPAVDLPQEALVEMVGNKWFWRGSQSQSPSASTGGRCCRCAPVCFLLVAHTQNFTFLFTSQRCHTILGLEWLWQHTTVSRTAGIAPVLKLGILVSTNQWRIGTFLQHKGGCFKKVKSTEQETISPQPTTDRMDTSEMKEGSYPPSDQGVAKNAK